MLEGCVMWKCGMAFFMGDFYLVYRYMKTIILFWSKSCGACTNFKPTWDKIKEKLANTDIEVKEYELGTGKKDNDSAQAEKKYDVQYIPTIIIETDGNGTQYKGPRTQNAIIAAVGGPVQCGGAQLKEEEELYYKMKYLKYKAKYLELSDNLKN